MEPQTPAELRAVFKKLMPGCHAQIEALVDKLEDVYCGEAELTYSERMFGRMLLTLYHRALDRGTVL